VTLAAAEDLIATAIIAGAGFTATIRASSHRDRRLPPGHHHRRGRGSPTRRWHPDA